MTGQAAAMRWLETHDPADAEAALEAVRPMVWSAARRWATWDAARRDDLRAEGMLGAWQALQAYRPDRGAAYSTYAYGRARGRMLHWLRAEGRVQLLIERLERVYTMGEA